MSDVLVKMLRGRCNCNMPSTPCGSEDECRFDFRVADRIEELEAELRLMKTAGIIEVAIRNLNVYEYMAHWERRAEKAEANLKKAAGALGDISNGEPEWPDDPQRELDWCRTRATTTLAELKGQDDE